MRFFRRRWNRSNDITQKAEVQVIRGSRVAARRENASRRRQDRVEIVRHRKWIFISLAIMAVVALIAFLVIKFGGFL